MSVGRICCREVYTAEPDETATEVAQRMRERCVGTLVILDASKRPRGIVTDRDLVVRVIAAGRDARAMRLRDFMTSSLHTVTEQTPIETALRQMCNAGIRRLIVNDEHGRLAGVLSLDDVLALLAEEMAVLGELVARDRPRAELRQFSKRLESGE